MKPCAFRDAVGAAAAAARGRGKREKLDALPARARGDRAGLIFTPWSACSSPERKGDTMRTGSVSRRWKVTAVIFSFAGMLMLPQPAYGYLDPGTGSFILQILIAALLGGFMAVKRFWATIAARGRHLLGLAAREGGEDV